MSSKEALTNPTAASTNASTSRITLRLPEGHRSNKPPAAEDPTPEFKPPPMEFLKGHWKITHSSLPLWKDKKNVTIDYTPLAPSSSGVVCIDDWTKYMTMSSSAVKSVHGVDTPSPNNPGAFDWRGKGWLKIASSHWELLGWGAVEELGDRGVWMVSYFQKTLFTPAGIDIYSRSERGLDEGLLKEVKATLGRLEAEDVSKLVKSMFKITSD